MASSTSSSSEFVYGEPERQSLQKPFIKSTKKSNYGSLRKETQQTTTAFIVNYKHRLVPGETLQGISLRYGIPVRQSSFNQFHFFELNLCFILQKKRLRILKELIDCGVMI
jgi:hypothetical protein